MKKLIYALDGDKRKRKRVEIFSNIPASIEALGKTLSAKIGDVSYSGLGIVLSSQQDFLAIDSLESKVKIANQFFTGKIANKVILPNSDIKIGIALPQEIHKEIDFNTTDASWDKVTDPEVVKNIYSDLVLKNFEIPINLRQHMSIATVFALSLEDLDTIVCEIKQVHQGFLDKGKVKCTFDLFQTCHAFEANIEKIDKNKIQIKTSKTLARLLRRETVRVKEKNSKFKLFVFLSNSTFDTVIEKYEVFDYSEHGLSLLDPLGDLSLPRNLVFDDTAIEVKEFGTIYGKAEVRSYYWSRPLKSYIIGLKFDPYSEPNLTNWHNLILKARYPTLDFNYKKTDHPKIWKLFDTSGYLAKKNDSKEKYVIGKTKKTWFKLNLAGTDFSKRIMLRDNKKIVGHMQIDKIYPKTWCVHHLAIDPTVSKIVARDLYSVTTDVLLGENANYLLNFTDANKPWNQRSYYDFIQNYRFKEHNEIKSFQVYINTGFKILNDQNYQIREANKYDLKKIIKFFESKLSRLEIDACALNQSDILLEDFNLRYGKFGLVRLRKFLVLYNNYDNFLGFSRVELGDEGVNIFNSLNMVYIYVLNEAPKKQEVINQLIIRSLELYEKKNIKDVLITLDDGNIEFYVKKGLTLFSDAVRWIALRDILPRYHAFCQLLYGHIVLKKETIRKRIRNNDK